MRCPINAGNARVATKKRLPPTLAVFKRLLAVRRIPRSGGRFADFRDYRRACSMPRELKVYAKYIANRQV